MKREKTTLVTEDNMKKTKIIKKDDRLVSVLIPSLNTLGFLKDCIKALKKSTNIPLEILVLDLGDDGTYEWCSKNGIKVWKHAMPFYFAQSNNYLADKATGDILLFLNSDTIPQKGFLEAMLEQMDNKRGDLVGCLMIYPNNTVQHAGIQWRNFYPSWNDLPDHIGYEDTLDNPKIHTDYDVKAITGSCLLIKKHIFEAIGKFDEQFRNCYEDVDLAIKAHVSGYKVRYTGKGRVIHYVSGSKGTDGKSRTSGQFMDESAKKLLLKYPSQPNLDESGQPESVKIQDEGYSNTIIKNNTSWTHRVLVGTPTTGNVRMEWVLGRYGQIIPTNWSNVDVTEWMSSYAPLEYLVPDAQNLIVRHALMGGFQWVLLFEQDNIPFPDAFIRMNDYMLAGDIGIVSGLYFTKSVPPEPIIYRGRGNSHFLDWKMGDKVWVDGVPTGFLLISTKVLQIMWDESAEYMVGGVMTRRVFECPRKMEYFPERGEIMIGTGTSDLEFCSRVMKDDVLERAGFKVKDKTNPFLCDTNIFLHHIDPQGRKYPIGGVPDRFRRRDSNGK